MAIDRGLRVELRPHIGVKNTPLGPTEIEHDQWIVLANTAGRNAFQIGYLNKRDGAALAWLPHIPPTLGKQLCDQLEALTAESRAKLMGGVNPSSTEEAK